MDSANKNITYKISFTTTGGLLGTAAAEVKHPYRNEADAVAKAKHLLESGLVHEAEVTKCETVFWQTAPANITPKAQ